MNITIWYLHIFIYRKKCVVFCFLLGANKKVHDIYFKKFLFTINENKKTTNKMLYSKVWLRLLHTVFVFLIKRTTTIPSAIILGGEPFYTRRVAGVSHAIYRFFFPRTGQNTSTYCTRASFTVFGHYVSLVFVLW